MFCVQNNLAYFPFMHWPLVVNQKARWSIMNYLLASSCSFLFFNNSFKRHGQFVMVKIRNLFACGNRQTSFSTKNRSLFQVLHFRSTKSRFLPNLSPKFRVQLSVMI